MEPVKSNYLTVTGITQSMIEETAERLALGEDLYEIACSMKVNISTLSLAFQFATGKKLFNIRKKPDISPEVVDEAVRGITTETTHSLARDLDISRYILIKAIKTKTDHTIDELTERPKRIVSGRKQIKATERVSQEMIDHSVRKLELGEAFKDIAKSLGVKYSVLNTALRTMTEKTISEHKTKPDPLSKEMVDQIIERLLKGESFISIAKSFGIKTNALHRKFLLQTGMTAYEVRKIHFAQSGTITVPSHKDSLGRIRHKKEAAVPSGVPQIRRAGSK